MIKKDLENLLKENKCSEALLTKINKSDWPYILYGDSSKPCILTLWNFKKLDDTQIGKMHLTAQQKEEIEQLMLKAEEVLKERAEHFEKKYPSPTLGNPYLVCFTSMQ